MAAKNWVDALRHITCDRQSIVKRRLLTVNTDTPLPSAFQQLIENRIQAVPVLNPTTHAPETILSVLDLTAHVLNKFKEDNVKELVKHTFDFFSLEASRKELVAETAGQLKELGELDPVTTISDHSTLFDAIQLMITKKAHRILVVDKDSRFVNIVTQFAALEEISKHLNDIPVAAKTLRQLELGLSGEVHTILNSAIAYRAFKEMREHRVTGLGVLNDRGQLVGNISASDIKAVGASAELFSLLSGTVEEYLHEIKGVATKYQSSPVLREFKARPLITARPDDTLADVIHKLVGAKIHRVYVTDDDSKPLGVVALGDVLRTIMASAKESPSAL